MLTKKLILFLPLLLLLVTCKKEKYPESVVINEPVYYSEMNVSGRSAKITAGENGYYNFTGFALDSNQVYVLSSEISKAECKTCDEALTFEFYDLAKSTATSAIDIDSLLSIGTRKFIRQGRSAAYTVEFRGNYNRSAITDNMVWDFGDGSTGKGSPVQHTYELAKPYNVCLSVKGNNGCMNTICNVLPVPSKGLFATISHTGVADSVVLKASFSGGTAPYTYSWDFGDGQKSTLASPSHIYSHTGSYPVTLTAKDASGKIGVFNYNLVTANDNSGCAASYSISAITPAVSGSQNWSKISLKYRSAEGNEYSSGAIDQNTNSKFEIVSVTDAGLNEKGDKLKKVELKFTAVLSNGIQNIEITNGRAFIAVAYK